MRKNKVLVILLFAILCLYFVNDVGHANVIVTVYSLNFDRKETIQLLNMNKENPELAVWVETMSENPYASYYSKNILLEDRNKYVLLLMDFLDSVYLPQPSPYFSRVVYIADEGYVEVDLRNVKYELYIPSSKEYKLFCEDSGYGCEPRKIGEILLYESYENSTVNSDNKTVYEWEGYLELNGYRFKCCSKELDYDEERMLRILQEAPLYTLKEAYEALGHDPDQEIYVPQEPVPEMTPSLTPTPTSKPITDISQEDRGCKIAYWACTVISITLVVSASMIIKKKRRL